LHEWTGSFALMFLLLGAAAAAVCVSAAWLPAGRPLSPAAQPAAE
jgi:hypothetical protein